jgi:26S proteasome regulatory subunit N1
VSVSNPKLQILDTLSKFSHDNDPEVALNAILAMGLAGAGMLNFIVLLYIKYIHLLLLHEFEPNIYILYVPQTVTIELIRRTWLPWMTQSKN